MGEQSEDMPAREWAILSGLAASQTVTEVAKEVGVACQRCHLLLRRAERRAEGIH